MSWGQVNLSDTPIGQRHIDLNKVEEASETTTLEEPGLGLFGPGDLAPNDALLLGQLPPPGGDRAESPAHRDLSRRARIKRDEGGITVLAIAITLPDCVPAFARLRDIKDFHN
jgi:hypothetical protein